jgi:hypothetical protein
MKENENLQNPTTYYIIYLVFIICGLFNNVLSQSQIWRRKFG